MRKIVAILFLLFLISCDTETNDCLQTEGKIITREISLPPFEEITIYDRVKLYISYGETPKTVVETGENLINDIKFSVTGNRLEIKNENTCNLFRDYGVTKIFITSPNLTYLRNGSQFAIESTNILPFTELQLVSEDASNEDAYHTDGDFRLALQTENLTIINNNISDYFLSGTVTHFEIGFYGGDGRLEAENLIAEDIHVYHRGTNKIIVNPQQSLTGKLVSTGDLISKNHPAEVVVEELYTGRLIFE